MNCTKRTVPQFEPTAYEDFFDAAKAPLDLAACIAETSSLFSRNIWRKRLEALGEECFRYELYLFWCDLRAGEEVRSRAKAFTARLNKAISARVERK